MDVIERAEHPIRPLLYSRRIPYRTVAVACGYSPGWIERVCNGRDPVSQEFAARVSRFLGVPADELFVQPEQQAVAADPPDAN
jgi:transcriptional regulator with XRE-family HTH domain